MSEQNEEKQPSDIESEVLVEKVREIELAKNESEKSNAKNSAKNNTAKILRENRELSAPMSEAAAKKFVSRRSRRTFLIGGATALAGIFGWHWMSDETKSPKIRRTKRERNEIIRCRKFLRRRPHLPSKSADRSKSSTREAENLSSAAIESLTDVFFLIASSYLPISYQFFRVRLDFNN